MNAVLAVAVPLAALYLLFLVWYGGRGKPLNAGEVDELMRQFEGLEHRDSPLEGIDQGEGRQSLLDALRLMLAQDDGQEFVMQNLVRYRPRALYPPGRGFGDDARAADRRYGKAIVPHLLRYGSVPVFIARRVGSFIEPAGVDAWHYVAMVRYRSRRDFARFALAIERKDIAMHKWAALEKTHVFLVQPLISLVFVRGAVAALLALIGVLLYQALR